MAKKRGMPESRWLAGSDPAAMLALLGVPVSERKLRLFACACCRRIWHQLDRYGEYGHGTADMMRAPAPVAEAYADGEATLEELREAAGWLGNVGEWHSDGPEYAFMACAADAADLRGMPEQVVYHGSAGGEDMSAEPRAQAALLRDVFGNPFRQTALDPAHRNPTVASLARAAYDERQLPGGELDPHRLAVLADALEDAGAPAELVAHLRCPGPHVRGCWAVDLVLGKQ